VHRGGVLDSLQDVCICQPPFDDVKQTVNRAIDDESSGVKVCEKTDCPVEELATKISLRNQDSVTFLSFHSHIS
jgi:hypothetical protein